MPVKRLTVKGETVDYCIQDALQRIGLPLEETLVRIHQREKSGLFGYREAVISITFDEEASLGIQRTRRLEEIKSRMQFRFDAGIAQVKVPSSFYGERALVGDDGCKEILLDFIAEHHISDPDVDSISKVMDNFQCQYNFVPVKTLETVELNNRGALIHIRIDEDQMHAHAIIFHGRHGARLQEVFDALKGAGICKGIRKRSIEKVLRSRYDSLFEIATGVPAIDDAPGEVSKFFQEDEHKEFSSMMEALTIDMRAVKDINIAERNQLLMTLADIIRGEDGYSIDGTTLEKRVLTQATAGINLGKNVYASDNGKEIYSKQSGHIVWKAKDGYIDVEPLYVVEGNVDFSEGNIIGFVGKVLIKGDVKPMFSVIAEGDIEIHGSVEDAVIKSTSGNVMVAGGIVNRSSGQVEAKETVHCMLTTNGKIKANRIIVEKEAMNSELDANTSIEVLGNPGVVVGGTLSARHLIKANTIGSERWVSTQVRVGDVSDLKVKTRGLRQTVEKLRTEQGEAEQIRHILQARSQTRKLTASQEQQLQHAQETIPAIEERIQDLVEEELFVKAEIDRRKDGKLEVFKVIYPQTDVFIYDAHMMPSTPEKYSGFRCRKTKVTRYSL